LIKAKVLFFAFIIFQIEVFGKTETLSERASNPITNLSQLQLESDYSPRNYGTDGDANELTIKPMLALNKTPWFPFEQLIRVKVQVPTIPDCGALKRDTSLGDTQFFDLFITEEPSWGRWGIGPMAIFPTATTTEAGQGKWQLGPALGISILKFPRWQIGFLAQNPISFAGNPSRPQQNYLLLQPFIIYHFQKNSYLITNSEWTIDWCNHTQQIPLNIGIGHTSALIGKTNIDSLIQFEWMAYQNALKSACYVNEYTIQVSFSILFGE
jgi:hypothetical protein